MSHFTISVDLLDDNATISKKIHLTIIRSLNNIINNSIKNIGKRIRSSLVQYLQQTPEYDSLVNGELSYHFGIPIGEGQSRLNAILTQIADNIYVKSTLVRKTGAKYSGGFSIRMLRYGFDDILSISAANITTEKGQVIPFMEWLLIRGNDIIISEHEISFTNAGRSGGAIMIQNNAGVWRVPPQYAGTVQDNWLTRSLAGAGSQFMNLVTSIIKEEIQRTIRNGYY